tara:strand:- start:663 stop:1214 length:552 start_codon:yes stop_codon:yes gene_type:complete
MSSSISHKIKQRENPKDVWITPECLAITHIVKTQEIANQFSLKIWYDPFKNSGNYYNNFPVNQMKDWAEILEGRDFFKYEPDDWGDLSSDLIICSNPPFSMMDEVYARCIELKPAVISLMVALHSITPRRIEIMNNAGYSLVNLHLCKVFAWYGMSAYVIFTLTPENPTNLGGGLSFDRNVWR